jgi:hypothetical protein
MEDRRLKDGKQTGRLIIAQASAVQAGRANKIYFDVMVRTSLLAVRLGFTRNQSGQAEQNMEIHRIFVRPVRWLVLCLYYSTSIHHEIHFIIVRCGGPEIVSDNDHGSIRCHHRSGAE